MLAISVYALRQPSGSSAQAGSATSTPTSAHHSSPSRPRSSSPAPSQSASTQKLPLLVLNNTTIHGLAQQAENAFVAGGWQVTNIGNLQQDIASTCAYYDPATPGAQQAADALMRQFPAIKRTAPKFDGLPAGPIVVVLTPDYVSG